MECTFSIGKKGQASLEFIFIIIIMLLYMHTIILPNVELATSSSKEIKALSEATFAGERLSDSINYIAASSGDANQHITLFIPEGATISCSPSPGSITVAVGLARDAASCPNKSCVKNFKVPAGIPCSAVTGPKAQQYMVSKKEGVVIVKAM